MKIRFLLPALVSLLAPVAVFAQTAPAATPIVKSNPATPTPPPEPALEWHDVTAWGVEGRGWPDLARKRWFQRLPDEAQPKVTAPVWNLSQDSAGLMTRFTTDSTVIWVRYSLTLEALAKPHMPATGVSGVDLYARTPEGKWGWVNVTKPATQQMKQMLANDLAPGKREYALYLPLFNGIEKLEIGVPPGTTFEGQSPRVKPIVFYGTSITHGACASRPGMVHTAILGRRLDMPVMNLGFSGNGRMDAGVGEYLAKLDAAVFVIDCLPNMQPADVRTKCGPLVKQLRAAHPLTPIVLVEDRRFTNSWIRPEREKFHSANHAALKESYEALKAEGITGLHYIPGDGLLGDDSEGATDASHPSDLGFMRQADAFEPVLRQALKK